jgi:hypothetical protein
MIVTNAIPAARGTATGRSHRSARADALARRGARFMSRLLLALVLAATSVLVPAQTTRFMEAPLEWADLFRIHRGLLPRRWVSRIVRCEAATPIRCSG